MALTIEKFIEDFTSIQKDIIRDHGHEDGTVDRLCKVMHRELALTETPADDADEQVERLRAMGIEAQPDILDLTQEHRELHKLLAGVRVTGTLNGFSPDDVIAAMFLIGRRYGMREASEILGSDTPDTPDALEA